MENGINILYDYNKAIELEIENAKMHAKYSDVLKEFAEEGKWVQISRHPFYENAYTYDIIYKVEDNWTRFSNIFSSAHLFPKYDTLEEAWEAALAH